MPAPKYYNPYVSFMTKYNIWRFTAAISLAVLRLACTQMHLDCNFPPFCQHTLLRVPAIRGWPQVPRN